MIKKLYHNDEFMITKITVVADDSLKNDPLTCRIIRAERVKLSLII